MPRASIDKPYTNFTGGLVTEASGLTYPENTAQDLDNVDLDISGMVRRRLGFDIEFDGESMSTFAIDPGDAVSVHHWKNPAGQTDIDFLVIQIGYRLIIRDLNSDTVSSAASIAALASPTEFDYSFWAWDSATTTEIGQSKLTSVNGGGRLWLFGPHIKPICLGYSPTANIVAISQFAPRIRDYTRINQHPYAHAATITDSFLYDLLNSGWNVTNINAHFTTAIGPYPNMYPDSAEQWILGKDNTNVYNTVELHKIDWGDSPAPVGRGIIKALDGVRDNIFTLDAAITTTTTAYAAGAGPDMLTAEDQPAEHGGSFTCGTFHQGRLWMAGDQNSYRPNGVYFSQSVINFRDAMKFYSVNDPTSESFSDPLDTDGGVIYITGAGLITSLRSFGAGVLVFATNGIWFVRGGDDGFRPTAYTVDQISRLSVSSEESIVDAEGTIYFWTQEGIFRIREDGAVESHSDEKIRSYFNNDLRTYSKESVVGAFDRWNNRS